MSLPTYLPIVVGVLLFCITFFIRSRVRNPKDTSQTTNGTSSPVKSKETKAAAPVEAVVPIYGPIHIFFGSQTGAAQNYSKILSEEAAKAGFEPQVVDLMGFTPELFKDVKIAIFALATHGEGEPTDNAKDFDEYIISKDRTGNEFKGLKYTVFALGNKQYQFYCATGRRADEHLARLGAERVYKLGEGDDNENLEDDFNAWKEGIWPELIKVAQVSAQAPKAGAQAAAQNNAGLPFVVNISSDLQEIDLENYNASNDSKEYDFQTKQYLASSTANIILIRELRQKTHDGSTLHVEIDNKSAGLTYKTAQNLGIYPENNPSVVQRTASHLGLDLKTVFSVEQNPDVPSKGKFKHPIPSPISVETYLTRFCDLQGTLRKKQLKDLAPFCSNEDNKNKLLFLASNEGKAEFEIQIASRMKGLLDIIEEFDVKITLDQLIQFSTLIPPRLYTIASSSKKHPDDVHLCVSISADDLPDGKKKVGVTSDLLIRRYKDGIEGKSFGKIRINIRDSTFSLPLDGSVPVIMVGPGAGVAPFKGFVDEKAHLITAGIENPYGDLTLYFGCKGHEWDYLYKQEFGAHHAAGLLKDLHCAFSRDQEHKIYVQDLILKNKDKMCEVLFELNGVFYICGSTAMGKAVMARLVELAAGHYKIEQEEAKAKIEELEKSKRIIKELWG